MEIFYVGYENLESFFRGLIYLILCNEGTLIYCLHFYILISVILAIRHFDFYLFIITF